MVAIVSGNSLGLSLTSMANLGQGGVLGTATQGQSGERAFVNVTNGNLVLQNQDDYLAAVGSDIASLRTYNSQGLLVGTVQDSWAVGAMRQRIEVSGVQLVRTDRDGARATHTADAANGYVSTSGGGAYDRITKVGDEYLWIDGATGLQERYDAAGRIVESIDTDSQSVAYTYTAAGQLERVIGANGETVTYRYDSGKLTGIDTVLADNSTVSKVSYDYDAGNRLIKVRVDLSPADGSIADGNVFETCYTYKGSSLQFADMFYTNNNSGPGTMQVGYGLNTAGTVLNFEQGELRQTGNNLDLAIDGQGLFTVQDSSGNLHYTRAGQFTFNSDGILVNRVDQSKVMGQDANGAIGEISIAGQSTLEGRATTILKFAGNLSSTATGQTIGSVRVIDSVGGEHLLSVKLTNEGATTPGSWSVEVLDGTTLVGTGTIVFVNGRPELASSTVSVTYMPVGLQAIPLTLDFSKDVTSFAAGNLSTLAFVSQDGFLPAALTGVGFDALGTLILTYANGQTVKGSKLSLGRFDSLDAVESVGSNQFDATNSLAWHTGLAGDGGFGSVRSGMVELSNVDLSQEFSDLVIMQRGYQASSQVISTANDMLQELFQMKSK